MTTLQTPRARPKRLNPWVSAVYDAWFCAMQDWEARREEVAIGYATEMKEFELHHPKPRLRDFMVHMSHGKEDR